MEPPKKKRRLSSVNISVLPIEILVIIFSMVCDNMEDLHMIKSVSRRWNITSEMIKHDVINKTRWTILETEDGFYAYLGYIRESLCSDILNSTGIGGVNALSIYNSLTSLNDLNIGGFHIYAYSVSRILEEGILYKPRSNMKPYEHPHYNFLNNKKIRREVLGDYDYTMYDKDSDSEEIGFYDEEISVYDFTRLHTDTLCNLN